MRLAVWGVNGSERDIGLVRRQDRLETVLKTAFRTMCIFGSIGLALCTAILALLSYLAAHRDHSSIVSNSPTVAAVSSADNQ
jgi:hypothetical protein